MNVEEDAESVARRIRMDLGITYELQTKFNSVYEALNHWKNIIEQKGVLIFQFGKVDRTEARGFSISKIPFPTISVNQVEYPQARIFSILHEYVHILLQQGGLCDFIEKKSNFEE